MPLWGDAWSDWHHIILRAPARLRQAVGHCPCRTSCAQEATKPWHVQYTSSSGHVFPLPISSVLTKGSAVQQTSRTLSYRGSRACACDGRRSGVALSFATLCKERGGTVSGTDTTYVPAPDNVPAYVTETVAVPLSQAASPPQPAQRRNVRLATLASQETSRRILQWHADRRYSRQMADQLTQDGVPTEHGTRSWTVAMGSKAMKKHVEAKP